MVLHQNRTFFRMHAHMMNGDDVKPDVNVTYRAINLCSLEKRFIYFVSDELYLIKPRCNCLSDSDSG